MHRLSSLTRGLLVCCLVAALGACAAAPSKGPGSAQAAHQNHGFTSVQGSADEWWNLAYPQAFDAALLQRRQEWIRVQGKRFTRAEKSFIFRGVSIADPSKLTYDGKWNKGLFEEISRWGANTIRIPIHPYAWRKHGRDWYFARLDEAVVWANNLDMYLIIDWHSMGNLRTEVYQHVMYETTQRETAEFWHITAWRYKNVPTVAIYEIFNEPTHDYMGAGPHSLGWIDWETWRQMLEAYIDLIRSNNKNAIPLVAGFNWGYDLTPVAAAPIRREGVAYAIHPYPQKAKPQSPTRENFFAAWEKTWGYVADTYPMIATELGWVKEDGYGAHQPVIHNEGTYGPNIVEYMASKGISYTAWIFDPDWSPRMIDDWNYTPSEQGEFFRQEMLKAKAQEAK
jgi:Endoglucanase